MTFHLARIVGITILLVLCMLYPFLPGSYDQFAVPLSAMIQAFGAIGLLLVPIGLLWLAHDLRTRARIKRNLPCANRGPGFAIASLIAGTIVAVFLSLAGLMSVGLSAGCLSLALWIYIAAKWISALKRVKNAESAGLNPLPFYLIVLPTAVLAFQLVLAAPVTKSSRNRAIRAGAELIEEIERHRTTYGRYPESLLVVHPDYPSSVVGVEKFHYAPSGKAYNLFFEQPRFLFDELGAREFVVFNKLDEHFVSSHAAWILESSPEQLFANQVRPPVHDASSPHWKYFWFD